MSQEPLPSPSQADQSFEQEATSHGSPKIWFFTDGLSPVIVGLTRRLLDNGDSVVCGIQPEEFFTPRADRLKALLRECEVQDEEELNDGSEDAELSRRDRLKIVNLDIRYTAQIQAGIADAIKTFGRIDVVLLCHSEALIGTIEEISTTSRTRSVVSSHFETNFFSAIAIVKSMLPLMRENKNGHIIALTGITAHLGTPGLAAYCASQWALEGYCDVMQCSVTSSTANEFQSLAYEVAPFNIKVTIVQPNIEVSVLTNKITTVPSLPEYQPAKNKAPLARGIFSRLLDAIGSDGEESSNQSEEFHSKIVSSVYPDLPFAMVDKIVAETIHALIAIGGHDNPPARLIVGFEGIASVKEKLRTVSEELEDFIEASLQADLPREGMTEEQEKTEARPKAKQEEDQEMDD